MWDGQDLTCDSPGVIRALEWTRGYTRKYGVEEMAAFGARSVPFASGQNFFMAGKIAMELQGIYFHQFIEKYAPDFELGVAPFPTDGSTTAMVTLVQADVLSIPRGARHPDEAWEFIRFVQRPEVMEDLCLRQRRFSPLKKTSEEFYARHPHPYIRLFRELAEKGDNQEWPRTPIQAEYSDELKPGIRARVAVEAGTGRRDGGGQAPHPAKTRPAQRKVGEGEGPEGEGMGRRAVTRTERRNLRNGLLFTLPWTIGLIVFTMFPAAMSLGFSLSDYSLLNEPVFVGLTNYKDMAVDNVFHTALWNTGVYAAMALPFGMVLAIALALLLNQQILARPVFRTIFFLPSLVPLVALAILWNWILQGNTGALNHLLGLAGIKGPNWLGDPAWSKPALVVTGLWGVGNAVVIYLAGLQDVPRDFYEAARVDGANWWQQTWHITLPMISPVIYFNLLMGCIGVLQIFAVPYRDDSRRPACAPRCSTPCTSTSRRSAS